MIYKIEPTNYAITFRATHTEERFPIGFTSVEIVDGVGRIEGIIRFPDFKGHGICKSLAERAIHFCKNIDCETVYIAIYHKREGLIKLYQSLGFKEINSLTPEYRRFELRE